MALLDRQALTQALTRLGEIAQTDGDTLELLLMGGTLMVLVFESREATRDVDVLILAPPEASRVRNYARTVAAEFGWPDDWLNDGAKGFLVGISDGPVVFSAPGVVVRRPSFEQLLAMKLCAWRDDVDISDARHLLSMLQGTRDDVWERVVPFLQPGRELKAQLAFADLWEEAHDSD